MKATQLTQLAQVSQVVRFTGGLLPEPLRRCLLPALGIPGSLTGLSMALLKATALDVAILAGHLVLYPYGIAQERRTPPLRPRVPAQGSAEADAENAPDRGAAHAAALPTRTRPPVVLLHGFIDNRSVFLLLRRSLAQDGHQHVESLNYSPLTCDIRTAARLLGRHVEEICERTGSDRVDIVGHSLGGLIARYYVQRLAGDTRVRTVVTLGTPHSGTRVVPLADAHPIVRQMRPGSSLLEELTLPAPGCRTRFVSFWSDLDHLMDPLDSARIDHPDLPARNVRVTGVGHFALPVHPAVAAEIRRTLDSAHDTPATPGQAGASGSLTVA
ncbi:alpha/beta fold hydrolase [Streptomyces sp. NPDC006610]|jgi:pimeloyl-ACP methyl ester carboxylesterase|uniref:esterase/lipase family protein n=1 Tax=Streptomyces sp. NPDC006610 TaxID=3154584 RepID=UPI0033BB2D76